MIAFFYRRRQRIRALPTVLRIETKEIDFVSRHVFLHAGDHNTLSGDGDGLHGCSSPD